MNKNQIGWQKYEDMLEDQMQSPLLLQLYKSFQDTLYSEAEMQDIENFTDAEIEELMRSQAAEPTPQENTLIQVDDKLMENINLVANFDCWMGHTNFDITEDIKKELDSTEGVEVLKICSRYRFFVGIGKMFDFKDVRKMIEKSILKKERNIE